ncbi:unnamed protein product [Paramecium sonneborni]|uniref:Uncharacterized protein n=1 Tax=Paramecium sonneborni TaxID=65129 RepID=A0A8S1QJX3_9CILI|nr:unnamed protein product [Paramecium sonneborni]
MQIILYSIIIIRFIQEIDKKQNYEVFGYVTSSNIRFLLLTYQDEERMNIFCQLPYE